MAEFDYYLDMLRGIRTECPELHIKAFTAIEIVHFSRIAHMSIREVLAALREAGLGSMPGAARRFLTTGCMTRRSRERCEPTNGSKSIARPTASASYTNATMLYGHVERPEERIAHLIKLRELQAESLARLNETGRRGDAERQECPLQLHDPPSPSFPSKANLAPFPAPRV